MILNTENLIGEVYENLFDDVLDSKHVYYNLKGGRGSGKSSFISIMIILLLMTNKNIHVVCYRKTAATLMTSVYEQIKWAIEQLGFEQFFKLTKNPLQIMQVQTGQQILFRGLDDAMKSKSIKVSFGYIGILWFEELDEFRGSEEIRKVQQSILRGGDKFWVFKSMNPPKSNANWANVYMQTESQRTDTIINETTYKDMPGEWLGQQFIDDAEWLKQLNKKAYRHEYLGEVVGLGSEVFDNLEIKQIKDEEVKKYDQIYMGIDWGWYPDPFRWVKTYYNPNRKHLIIYDELNLNKTSNEDAAKILINKKGVKCYDDRITCDSAEPKSISDFRAYGINARGAEKGAGSVNTGLKWLQSLAKITIDPVRCPKTADEFEKAEYEINKDGEVMNSIPDINNHSIDAVRYAMERVWKRRGN